MVDVLDLLTRLVDKSLVVAHQTDTVRYRLLEPLRQYAGHHLTAAGEAPRVRARHHDWCLDLVERAGAALWTERHTATLAHLEREHDNLRAALDWCLTEHAPAECGLHLAGSLWQFWLLRGYLAEGHRWLERALAGSPQRSAARAATLLYVFALASRLGDTRSAAAAAEQSLDIYRALRDTQGIVRAAISLGCRLWLDGERARPQALFVEGLALAREAGQLAGAALATYALGILAWSQHDCSRSRMLLEESLALLRQAPDERNIASVFVNLGYFEMVHHEDGAVTLLTEETVLLLREVATSTAIGFVLANLGNLARVEGDNVRAHSYLEQSVAHFRRTRDQSGLAQVLGQLGNLARVEGEYDRAHVLLAESLALRRHLAERLGIGRTLDNQGTLALARGDYAEARALYEESLSLFREMGDRPYYTKSEYLDEIDDGAIDTLITHATRMASPLSAIHIHHMGGAVARPGPDETAYTNRNAPFTLNVIAAWGDPGESQDHVAWVRELAAAVQPFATGGVYVNFLGDEGEERVRAAYGAAAYDRLVAAKTTYDPTNLFRLNQNVKPRP